MIYVIFDTYNQPICSCENLPDAQELCITLDCEVMYRYFLWGIHYNDMSLRDAIHFANSFKSTHYVREIPFI